MATKSTTGATPAPGSTATDLHQLFTADRAAALIGGHHGDVLGLMMDAWREAGVAALTWANSGDHTRPWPMRDPEARGRALVDQMTEDACAALHHDVAIDGDATHANVYRRMMLGDFEACRFRRAELARWVKAMGLGSAYEWTPAPERESVDERRGRRWARFEELGGKVRRTSDGLSVQGGRRGAAADLAREEQAAGRPMSAAKEIRLDLVEHFKAMTARRLFPS